jgi:lipopolysaccharide transport system permease protein
MGIQHATYSAGPLIVFQTFWRNRSLIWQMSKREVIGRYRGSIMGLLWSFFNPLLMLAVYTFVFGIVLQVRWENQADSKVEFASVLFAGLIVFTVFSECVNRAPSLILGNVNYVKRVVFPLESLPWVIMGAAIFHSLVSVLALLLIYLWVHATLHWTILLFPLIMLPLLLLTMGCSWFLASVGVFLRDVGQVVGILTTVLLFTCPIFYPPSAIPESLRPYLLLNPLAFIVAQARNTLLWGKLPDWPGLGLYFSASVVVAWLGLLWFQKTRKGFADVL